MIEDFPPQMALFQKQHRVSAELSRTTELVRLQGIQKSICAWQSTLHQ
jgi:hypothetical protein